MEIYVVQQGDNIESIANRYSISVERLIADNGLINPYSLVVGQTLIILYPKSTYTVKQGDSLSTIADSTGISIMQLIRNNPLLYDREYLYPGETLVIKYNTSRDVIVNGYTNVFLNPDILTRALPYLTYISIFNYRIADVGGSKITSFGDDADIISKAKQYSTIPLLMISALSQTGDLDVEYVYKVLLDIKLQDELIENLLQLVRSKGFMGINLLISYISEYNQSLYISLLEKISKIFRNEGYIIIITVSPDFSVHENLDYHSISLLVDRIIFLQNIWTKQKQPPAPISNISLIKAFIADVVSKVSPNYISLGKPLLGLDWALPFYTGSIANLLSLNTTILQAYDQGVVIQLDAESQTPYYDYITTIEGVDEKHKVWFVDAHSFLALDKVVIEYNLTGTGIWNITTYSQQLFSITNATYNIIKFPIQQ